MTRTHLDIEEFNFDVVHIKSTDNMVADALSRISLNDIKYTYNVQIKFRCIVQIKNARQINSNRPTTKVNWTRTTVRTTARTETSSTSANKTSRLFCSVVSTGMIYCLIAFLVMSVYTAFVCTTNVLNLNYMHIQLKYCFENCSFRWVYYCCMVNTFRDATFGDLYKTWLRSSGDLGQKW